jgi:hypothetical protein
MLGPRQEKRRGKIMARTLNTLVTPDMGPVEISRGTKSVSVTVLTGAAMVTATTRFLGGADIEFTPVGPMVMTASYTDNDGTEWNLTDTRTPQQRQHAAAIWSSASDYARR